MILGRIHSADMNAQRAAGWNAKLPPHPGGVRGPGELGGIDAVINHSAPQILLPRRSPGVLETRATHAENPGGGAVQPMPHERPLQ